MEIDEEREQQRRLNAIAVLKKCGFTHLTGWSFAKGGNIYDMSAADLGQIDLIEANELFVISDTQEIQIA